MKKLDLFYKFLIIMSPIVGVLLIFLFKSFFYVCVRIKIKRKNLNIHVLRNNFNLFLESNKLIIY